MRRPLPVVLTLAIAGGALAAPTASPTWADWVGDWSGKLRWTGCTVDGEPSAMFSIDATDGVVVIDLSQASHALGAIQLIEDEGGWIGQHGDVTVHVTRPHGDTLDVAVELDSGCAMRAAVHRPTTGIASCDRLSGWARIEARCSRLSRPPFENVARLVRQRQAWSEVRGDARARTGAQCEARAAKVLAELVDVGCAPNSDPAIGRRGAACQALRRSAAKLSRCPSISSDIAGALEGRAGDLAAAAQTADDASLPVVEAACQQLHESIVAMGQKLGCPPPI